jgi:HEPN domain-containing protein
VSPRSEEYMEQARERLADAQKILGLGAYEATPPTAEQAAEFVDAAAKFVAAIEKLLLAD